jgi:hypothetical protein
MKMLQIAPLHKEIKVAIRKDLPTLLDVRDEIKDIIANATDRLKDIDAELYKRVEKEPTRKLVVEDRTVQIVERLSFTHVSLEVAKKYKAVKKVPDSSVLKPLYLKGYKVEGVSTIEYVYVK